MSPTLYEKLEERAENVGRPELPDFVTEGLRSDFELRPYQATALADFIAYFEATRPDGTLRYREFPAHVLFHMATGSGKTLLMAGLMLYLYGRGYRDFLFFVNSTNVLEKTKSNLLDPGSLKHLFGPLIRVHGDPVQIREVSNFTGSQPDAINICFSTIQGLHARLANPRENEMTVEDFEERRVVLISDEAHHINVATRRGLSRGDAEHEGTWESTVARILAAHPENVLVEFTATIDLANAAIKAKYDDRIVADYPLSRYRADGYSKEIKLLQTDLPALDRALAAVVLSQFRLKLFERRGLAVKPVILLKSKTIRESREFFAAFEALVSALDGTRLALLRDRTTADVVRRAFEFFAAEGLSLDLLALELRESFSRLHCLSLDSKQISPSAQIAVNTLESRRNPYRAIFAVDMLNEGWDVLNLFDIVRLYETRDAREGRPGRSTLAEAQLIGRGARYWPFRLEPTSDAYRRKFDGDLDNEMRVCEELYFHSASNVRYIEELRAALRETGALPQQSVPISLRLKDAFVESDFYQHGWVFANERRARNRDEIKELPANIRSRQVTVRVGSGASRIGEAFGRDVEAPVDLHRHTKKLSELAAAVRSTALRRNEQVRFDRLRAVLPNLASMTEFATSPNYAGDVQMTLETRDADPAPADWLRAAEAILKLVGNDVKRLALEHYGTREFVARPVRGVITNRTVYVADPTGDGVGIPQSRAREELRLDLTGLDWFAYDEHYGTTEEKRFVVYFNQLAARLKASYDLVVLLRNEGQLPIFDFDTGAAFQPDFLLIVRQADEATVRQYQVFVEPKGAHLAEKDRWKEDLLLRLEAEAVPVERIADDVEYRIWGLPFYSHHPPAELRRFTDAMEKLILPAEVA